MAYKHETTREMPSAAFPGVTFYLKKMTEGRRVELRRALADTNKRVRQILSEQDALLKGKTEQDGLPPRYLELQDEFEELMMDKIDPTWLKWGLSKITGLEVGDAVLTLDDWQLWPSELYREALALIKQEVELNGAERKNLLSPTISGEQVGGDLSLSPASTVAN